MGWLAGVGWGRRFLAGVSGASLVLGIGGCGVGTTTGAGGQGRALIQVVGAESQYANVAQQIGGRAVTVTAVMRNPNTDPHTYEAGTTDAATVGQADLIIQNGLGYDGFMNKLEAASPKAGRQVIDLAASLGYGADTADPHLWYNPATMPQAAKLIAAALTAKDPKQAAYFATNLKAFDRSLADWDQTLSAIKQQDPGAAVAVTEPVADYMLQAAGLAIKTPWTFQTAVMNGVDPSPQDVQIQDDLFKNHQVKVFIYNEQAVVNETSTLLALAKQNKIPVIGVDETMPPGRDYQTWMESEARALEKALATK